MSNKAAAKFNFTLETSTTIGGAYTELVKFRVGKLPSMEKEVIRYDDITDEWQKFLSGRKKLNEMQFEALLTSANFNALLTHFDVAPGIENKFYRISWPVETGTTTPRRDAFEGVLKMIDGASLDVASADAATIPFTIQPSGSITTTPAA